MTEKPNLKGIEKHGSLVIGNGENVDEMGIMQEWIKSDYWVNLEKVN